MGPLQIGTTNCTLQNQERMDMIVAGLHLQVLLGPFIFTMLYARGLSPTRPINEFLIIVHHILFLLVI